MISITTIYPFDVGYESIVLIGVLSDLDGHDQVNCCFEYADNQDLLSSTITARQPLITTGDFTHALTGLDNTKTYHFRAVAVEVLTWDVFDALNLTWDELDALNLTWGELDLLAPKTYGEILMVEPAETPAKEFAFVATGAATAEAQIKAGRIFSFTAQGRATASAAMLILAIPSGVYNIDADNIFNRNQPITPDSLANYIEVWINPLKPAAEPEEVYKTDEDDPFPIAANETKTVTIHYKKEPVTEVNIEFVNAPPYATIDSIKHYAWGADVTVTSPDAGTFELKATGKPLEVQGRELVVREDETSILENGIKKFTFDNPFVQDRATAEMIGDQLLNFAIPQADIEIDWRGDPALVLADVTMIPEFQRQGLDQRGIFYVVKQELEYDGGLRAKLAGRKMGGNE
jgi:hypothetical protein